MCFMGTVSTLDILERKKMKKALHDDEFFLLRILFRVSFSKVTKCSMEIHVKEL